VHLEGSLDEVGQFAELMLVPCKTNRTLALERQPCSIFNIPWHRRDEYGRPKAPHFLACFLSHSTQSLHHRGLEYLTTAILITILPMAPADPPVVVITRSLISTAPLSPAFPT
jgi:hypothetical protein